jgi:hypothetical protein
MTMLKGLALSPYPQPPVVFRKHARLGNLLERFPALFLCVPLRLTQERHALVSLEQRHSCQRRKWS